MKIKGEAMPFDESDGYFTKGCSTKEEAKIAIEEAIKDWAKEPYSISIDDIKEDLAFEHKVCDGYITIGENWCLMCGEPTTGKGRRTFVYSKE